MRIALTGAATGIGAATAARFKSDGAEVIAFDIEQPKDNIDRWIAVDLSSPLSVGHAVKMSHVKLDASSSYVTVTARI